MYLLDGDWCDAHILLPVGREIGKENYFAVMKSRGRNERHGHNRFQATLLFFKVSKDFNSVLLAAVRFASDLLFLSLFLRSLPLS